MDRHSSKFSDHRSTEKETEEAKGLNSHLYRGHVTHGIVNQGSTCYLSAVLQCLYGTQEFRRTVQSFTHAGAQDLTSALQKLFRRLSVGTATSEEISRSLSIRSVWEQQDAAECYRSILSAVRRPASEVFEGEMIHKHQCGVCGGRSEERSSFLSLPLSIQAGSQTVEENLKAFFTRVLLEEDDWMFCERCDCKTPTESWTEIQRFPRVLTLHLKRFDFSYERRRYVKNHSPLELQTSLRDQEFLQRKRYDLYAVIEHSGDHHGGHYQAVVRSPQDGRWFCFNDSAVSLVRLFSSELLRRLLHSHTTASSSRLQKIICSAPVAPTC